MRSTLAPFVARFGLLSLLLAVTAALLGCERDAPLSLLTVREVAPRDVEVGERIEITGSGFPRGRAARVILEGTLHRPGAEPRRGFEVRAEGVVVNESTVELAYDARLQSLFCGPESGAVHTTFRGDATVAFAAAIPGAPPAAATLPGVVLDLRPAPGNAVSTRMRLDGERFLESEGIVVDSNQDVRGGLLLAAVHDGSAADRAGLLAGDLLVSFDGVLISSAADVVPAPTAQRVTLGIRRGGDPNETPLIMAVDGYRPRPAILPLVITALLAAAASLWLFAPLPRSLRWLARRIGRTDLASKRTSDVLSDFLPLAAIPLTVALPLILRELVGAEPEIVSILLATLFGTFVLHALAGEGGVGAALRRAATSVLPILPAALAIAAAGVLTGATRLTEASHAQGGWLWEFLALRGFSNFVLFAVAMLGLSIPEETFSPFGRAGRVRRAGSRAAVYTLASITTIALFGGWQSPTSGYAELTGAALYCAKAGLLGGAVLTIRSILATPKVRTRGAIVFALASGVAGAATLASLENRYATAADVRLVAIGLSAILAVAALRIGWLTIRLGREPAPRLDPFS
jgi:hypothetical protein